MPASQFTIYTSSDPRGPGLITGQTGSLNNILDACLVDGYGSGSAYYRPAAGWTKPLPDISASVGSLPQLAAYKQASGSQMILFVNDAGPNVTSTAREAWITGWELMTALTGSGNLGNVYTASNSAGSGYGQFPLPSQLLTYGHCVVRKSTSADGVGRTWIIAADAHTMYMWISTGDSANRYYHFAFGDIFSFGGVNDTHKCMIMGRAAENSAGVQNVDWTSEIAQGSGYHVSGYNAASTLGVGQPGCYLVKNFGKSAGSLSFTKKGDPMQATGMYHSSPAAYASFYQGAMQTPNSSDNSFFIHPIIVVEPGGPMMRGRLRGIYHPCHPITNFNNGQIITAGGDYIGKTFMCILTTPDDAGVYLLETSNTVETNG
jgi:hypothetical protein